MIKQVVLIASPAQRSGKSTVAQAFIDAGYTRLKFAGVLKAMLVPFMEGLGIDDPSLYIEGHCRDVKLPIIDVTARHLMQTLGTEWGRDSVDAALWAKLTFTKALQFEYVVIDDWRFPNELETAYQLLPNYCQITTINVVRPSAEDKTGHRSEGNLTNHIFDVTIINDGTTDQLIRRAMTSVSDLKHANFAV